MRRLLALVVLAVVFAVAPSSTAAPVDNRVGAVYFPSVLGLGPVLNLPHICSASVVHSSSHDLVAIAAHCVYGNGIGYQFVPGYNKGSRPAGIWTVRGVYVDPAWKSGNDPRHDVAFLRIAPQLRNGHQVNIEDVTGAFTLGTAPTPGTPVTVTGYKLGTNDAPMTCQAATSLTSGYPTVACNGFVDGTSGGPWVAPGDRLVGVIGGLNEGGCTPLINYSAPFDASTAALLARANAGGPSDAVLPPLSNGC